MARSASSKNRGRGREKNSGFIMIEILVTTFIAVVLLGAFATLVVHSMRISRANAAELKGEMYLRELIEISKDVEVTDWNGTFKGNVCLKPIVCHPTISSGKWAFALGSETLEGNYVRSLSWEPVYRSSGTFPNTIVDPTAPGATLDPNTVKVTAAVTWNTGFTNRTSTLQTYVYQMP